MIIKRKLQQLTLISAALVLIGCVSIGTRLLPKNQRGFNNAVISSAEQQLLLNIVRIQFEDRPFFLSVESITTSNSLSMSGGGSVSYSPSSSGNISDSTNGIGTLLSESISNSFSLSKSFGFSPSTSYSDSPTISYSPLQGERFTRQMLSTTTINALFLLLDSGWNAERVMRIMLEGFGEYENVTIPSRHHIPDAHQFEELVQYLDDLQEERIIYFSTGSITSVAIDRERPLLRRKIRYNPMSANKIKTHHQSLTSISLKSKVKTKNNAHLTMKQANKLGSPIS